MKRLKVSTVGLSVSDRLLLSAFLDLVALTDGHVFALVSEDSEEAAIVFVNPNSAEGAQTLARPQPMICYVVYAPAPLAVGANTWTLLAPVRLGALRDVLIAIVDQRRQFQLPARNDALPMSVAAAPISLAQTRHGKTSTLKTDATVEVPLVAAHRKLEFLLRLLDRISKDRIPHALYGVPGVEILVFPDVAKVVIKMESGISSWSAACLTATRSMSAMPRVGAQIDRTLPLITLERFKWELARVLSLGMLLPGIAHLQSFSLLRWPDFGALGASSAYDLRICAMLTSLPASIEQILKAVPISRISAIALLNGCALVGCLRNAPEDLLTATTIAAQNSRALEKARSSVPTPQQAPVPPRSATQQIFAGFLGKLRAALSFTPRVNE